MPFGAVLKAGNRISFKVGRNSFQPKNEIFLKLLFMSQNDFSHMHPSYRNVLFSSKQLWNYTTKKIFHNNTVFWIFGSFSHYTVSCHLNSEKKLYRSICIFSAVSGPLDHGACQIFIWYLVFWYLVCILFHRNDLTMVGHMRKNG